MAGTEGGMRFRRWEWGRQIGEGQAAHAWSRFLTPLYGMQIIGLLASMTYSVRSSRCSTLERIAGQCGRYYLCWNDRFGTCGVSLPLQNLDLHVVPMSISMVTLATHDQSHSLVSISCGCTATVSHH